MALIGLVCFCNYGGVMAIKVKTPYFGSFNLPGKCVVCGAAPGVDRTLPVSGSKSNWSGKQTTTLSVNMPMCDECYAVSRYSTAGRAVTCLGGILAFGACILTSGLVGSSSIDNPFIGVGAGIAVVVLLFWLGTWLGERVHTKNLSAEQIELRKRVKKAATITSFQAPNRRDKLGAVVFEFQNQDFASGFSQLNMGQIM